MPADFFVIHPEKLPMAGGIYFIYAMYGLCVRNMVVIWSFDEMGLREQVILSDKGNRETEQIMLFYFKKRSGHQEKM